MTDPDFPNEAAAKAFANARAQIARVKEAGRGSLWLDGDSGFSDLTHVPEEIVELEGLWHLSLDQTQITDTGVQHIAGLQGLETLYLSQTQITDAGAQHIAGMEVLKILSLSHTQITMAGLQVMARQDGFLQNAYGDYGTLYLDGTPALEDDGLRAVYKADYKGDNPFKSKRTKAVLDYARNWKPPVPEDAPFAPRYHMDPGGPITSDPINPSAAADEIAALKDICLQKATRLADTLNGNNEYAWINTAAENYVTQMQKPFTKLALQILFAHVDTLLLAHQQHMDATQEGRVNDVLPPKIAAALADIVRTHGLWWSGMPEAAQIDHTVKRPK
ncbi:MAG: leucine-rich repeat domain-containing protein [Planktomarina sp.]